MIIFSLYYTLCCQETVDAMIDSGLGKMGYEYINLDDCWQAPERDREGRVQPDPERFPNGLKHLSDYVHDRGFKFGIYSSAGFKTCEVSGKVFAIDCKLTHVSLT